MRTKDEIINSYVPTVISGFEDNYEVGYDRHTVSKIINECAKDRSIAFAEWLVIRYKTNFYNGTYLMCVKYGFELNRIYTIAELYELFTKENQEK